MQRNGLIQPQTGYVTAAAAAAAGRNHQEVQAARGIMARDVIAGTEGACAVCRSQRKRCDPGKCHLRPYLPADKMEEFTFIHRTFGVSNLNKMFHAAANKRRLVDTLIWEARRRRENRDEGCFVDVEQLCEEIIRLRKLVRGCGHCSVVMPRPLLLSPDVPLTEDLKARYTESYSNVSYLVSSNGSSSGGLHPLVTQPSQMFNHGGLNEAATGITTTLGNHLSGYFHALNTEHLGNGLQGRGWYGSTYNIGSQHMLGTMQR